MDFPCLLSSVLEAVLSEAVFMSVLVPTDLFSRLTLLMGWLEPQAVLSGGLGPGLRVYSL